MTSRQPSGHIHAGSAITPGGRYDRLLKYLRAHPGATTREICRTAEIYAFTPTVSELRRMGFNIVCDYDRTTEGGAKVHRYFLLENKQDAAPVARQETQPAGAADGNHAVPAAVKQEDLWQP